MIGEKRMRDARSVVRWHVITYQTKQQYKFSVSVLHLVCSLQFVPSLHFVPGLQSAVCILYRPDLYCCFLFERASSPDRNIGARKIILVRLSWPLWLMCGLYVEELPRTSTLIGQWLLYTNWGRTQMRGLTMWLLLTPFCAVIACVEMNPLRVP